MVLKEPPCLPSNFCLPRSSKQRRMPSACARDDLPYLKLHPLRQRTQQCEDFVEAC